MLMASMPCSASVAARRSGPSGIRDRRVESTSFTSASTARSARSDCHVGWQSQSRGIRSGAHSATVEITTGPAAGSLTSSDRSNPLPHRSKQLCERRDVRRQHRAADGRDRPLAPADLHHTVVVEYRYPVRCEPHVALEAGGAEPQRELERRQRVLRGVRPRTPVGEGDRRVEQRRKSLLHHVGRFCRPPPGPGPRSVPRSITDVAPVHRRLPVVSPSCST